MSGSVTDRAIDLPPAYELVTLREVGDAFAHGCALAEDAGAGVLVWVRRYDLAEFAVILEPEEPLAEARRAIYVGMNALADALTIHAPPERPISFNWPDAILIDGVLVGGGRLGWPEGARENEIPRWLVFSGMVRTCVMRAGEAGLRPRFGGLDELGFEVIDAGAIIESFSRHLMSGFHDWNEIGFASVSKPWLSRLSRREDDYVQIADNGDLLISRRTDLEPSERRSLKAALATPSWLDPGSGTPWLSS